MRFKYVIFVGASTTEARHFGGVLLICSISDDSHDIYYLLDTLDGRRPSAERKEAQ